MCIVRVTKIMGYWGRNGSGGKTKNGKDAVSNGHGKGGGNDEMEETRRVG